jgi:hypothetical protein
MEVATPHVRGLLVAALSTGGRLRDIPVGQRLAAGLDMLLTDSEGATLPHDAFVFGDHTKILNNFGDPNVRQLEPHQRLAGST